MKTKRKGTLVSPFFAGTCIFVIGCLLIALVWLSPSSIREVAALVGLQSMDPEEVRTGLFYGFAVLLVILGVVCIEALHRLSRTIREKSPDGTE